MFAEKGEKKPSDIKINVLWDKTDKANTIENL